MNLELIPTKSADDTEIDTPPHPTTTLSFTNGALKHHPSFRAPPPPPPAAAAAPAYKECMKNHAATLGGHAVDGCGEFMPPPPTTTAAAAAALKCAACGCHRNFHRREPETTVIITPPFLDFRRPYNFPKRYSPTPPEAAAEEHHQAPVTPTAEMNNYPVSKKRFRSKFSQEQKEKMRRFSEKVGWRMVKSDDVAVAEFCGEIGVGREVLKVWMHNNKNTFGGGRNKEIKLLDTRLINFENNGGSNGVSFGGSNCNGSSSSSP